MKDTVIAVDAMGGDNAPVEIIKGCVEAVKFDLDIKLVLVGIENQVKSELEKYDFDNSRIEIVNATEVIATDEVPTTAIKKKKDSSMVVGLKLVKDGKAQALVSAGNTGALLTGSTLIIGRIKGIERPALGTMLPTETGTSLLLDSGANVDSKASYLAQYAKMGSVYMENVMGIANPKIGLINIGAEKEKGNALTKEAYEILEKNSDTINFYGNIEAREISEGLVDVLVCDAFVGNVILKYSEGFSKFLLKLVKKELLASFISKIGTVLASGAFKRLKKYIDYSKIGGAPFLGLNSLVVKAHGNSDYRAIKGAINQCSIFIKADIVEKIKAKI